MLAKFQIGSTIWAVAITVIVMLETPEAACASSLTATTRAQNPRTSNSGVAWHGGWYPEAPGGGTVARRAQRPEATWAP